MIMSNFFIPEGQLFTVMAVSSDPDDVRPEKERGVGMHHLTVVPTNFDREDPADDEETR